MPVPELTSYTVSSLAKLTRLKKVAPVEVVEGYVGLVRDQMEALQRFDVLLSPIAHAPPVTIDEDTRPFSSDQDVIQRQFGARSFLTLYSVAALPAVVLPRGFSSGGVPIELQMGGKPFDEATILKAAFAFESATDWHPRRDPV